MSDRAAMDDCRASDARALVRRYLDRFTVVGGKLRDQQVWNDLAEARPGPREFRRW